MSLASSILKQQDKVLAKYFPQERLIYKRSITRSGGDPLLGRGVAVETYTTLLSPQPIYQRLVRNIVGSDKFELTLNTAGVGNVDADYSMLISATAMTTRELDDPDTVIVFIDDQGGEETFTISDHEPQAIQGTLIFTTVYIKSTKRPV